MLFTLIVLILVFALVWLALDYLVADARLRNILKGVALLLIALYVLKLTGAVPGL